MDYRNVLEKVLTAATFLHSMLKPVVEHLSVVNSSEHHHVDVVRRSAIRRQYDSVSSTLALVDLNLGDTTVPLLRPACEEFIWLSYFNKIGRVRSMVLVEYLLFLDISQTVNAQRNYVGDEAFDALGVTDQWKKLRSMEPRIHAQYFGLAAELEFPKRSKNQMKIPPFSFIAERVSQRKLYDYLYYATSKTVHFSVHELTRRPAGKPPLFKMKSPVFGDYWSVFSLIWGIRLLFLTLEVNKELMVDLPDLDVETYSAALATIREHIHLPIILPRELRWPEDIPPPASVIP